MITLDESEIIQYVKDLELESKRLRDNLYRLCWYMRGGVSIQDLLYNLGPEDREIMDKIVEDHIKISQKTGMNII